MRPPLGAALVSGGLSALGAPALAPRPPLTPLANPYRKTVGGFDARLGAVKTPRLVRSERRAPRGPAAWDHDGGVVTPPSTPGAGGATRGGAGSTSSAPIPGPPSERSRSRPPRLPRSPYGPPPRGGRTLYGPRRPPGCGGPSRRFRPTPPTSPRGPRMRGGPPPLRGERLPVLGSERRGWRPPWACGGLPAPRRVGWPSPCGCKALGRYGCRR